MNGLHAHKRQAGPAGEQASRTRARGEVNVFLQSAPQPDLFVGIEFGEGHEIAVKHILGLGTQHISKPAGHARTEIQAEGSEDDGYAAGHVLTSMLANTFHYGKRTAVSDTQTLPPPAGNKKLARHPAGQHGLAGKNVAAP